MLSALSAFSQVTLMGMRYFCYSPPFYNLRNWAPVYGASLVTQTVKSCRRPSFNLWVWKIPWYKKQQPTLVFLPGKYHGQRSLASYNSRSLKVGNNWVTNILTHKQNRHRLTNIRTQTCGYYGEREWGDLNNKTSPKSVTIMEHSHWKACNLLLGNPSEKKIEKMTVFIQKWKITWMFDSSPSLRLKTPTSCLYKKGYKKDYKTMKGGRR